MLEEAHVKTPDSIWRGGYWEYKTPSSKTSIDDRIRSGRKQLFGAQSRNKMNGTPGIVIDIKNSKYDRTETINIIMEKNIKRKKVNADIIIRDGKELVKAIRQ